MPTIDKIKDALGIRVVQTRASTWSCTSRESRCEKDAQIDLVIERADDCINLFEIKLTNTEYSIDKEYAKTLNLRSEIFRTVTKTKKSLFTTMITTYGVKQNEHYYSAVQNQLTMDDLFDEN